MAKFNDIRELAQQNARWVSNSPKDWMNYLDVAARLYRYSFKDTLLIHAQRPDATACAELEVWNKKMNRWVNRGAKGIALLDDASPRAKLRYVFDIADTHLVQGGRTPILWRIDYSEHQQMILDHLADEYYQAQKAIRNVAPIQYKTEDDFALKGKICCGNCRRQLRHEKQYGEMVFCCGHKRSVGKFSHCYSGYYREQAVNSRVARAIKTVFTALEVVNQGMQEKKSITLQCVDVDDLKKQAEMIRAEQIKLYESYADGILTRNEYLEKKKGLGEKLADLQEKIRIEEEEQETADELDEEIRNLTKQASQKTYIGGLTKECVDAFVSMVYLYDDQTMKVEFNCEDVIRRALEKYGA